MKNMKTHSEIEQTFQTLLNGTFTYKPDEIETVFKIVRPFFRFAYKQKTRFFNVPCAFDIETTSFSTRLEKEIDYRAIMYEWTFGIFGCVIIGRTWEEFEQMIDKIVSILNLNENTRLVVYVHNLAFEFQWIRKHFNWHKVFAIDNRKPVYAITENGIEFRCSYILSGYSLEHLAKNLNRFKMEKFVGGLNYLLKRHAKTPLSPEEVQYCVFDVKIVMAYVWEEILSNKTIALIPLTKTGYVRRYVRAECRKNPYYHLNISKLTLTAEEYKQLKRAFQGGFTHANPFFADKVTENVASYDFTSSYPAVMLTEQFPMSCAENVEIKNISDLQKNLKYYCCLFDVEFTEIESTVYYESYISMSRCYDVKKPIINNGRIVAAQSLKTTITEQDFKIIRKFYKWKKIRITNFKRYKKDYLPKEFITSILDLYETKTKLKGVPGESEVIYKKTKELLNSCYGMCVTSILRDEYTYTDKWEENTDIDVDKVIEKYNKNKGRFLYFPWGVWVTAYARVNLFTAIMEFNTDYIYSDTDSVKVRNAENHIEYINKYNDTIIKKGYAVLDHYEIPRERFTPETIKGVKKPLGVWDFEGVYKRFKSVGAKRYMVETENGISITVSGLNKKYAIPYICKDWCYDLNGNEYNSPFDKFTDELYVPPKYTGKLTHRYIDERKTGFLTDYMGKRAKYDELSSVHLENADYSLSIAAEYARYILQVEEIYK